MNQLRIGVDDLSEAHWRTSTRSIGNGNCVEVATIGSAVGVRDSKDPDGTVLTFGPAAWTAFASNPPVA